MPDNSITYDELKTELADSLAYTRDSSKWDSTKIARLESFIASGYQRFLYNEQGYDWSFLRPVATLITVVSKDRYDLPDDFGSMVHDFTWPATGDGNGARIKVVGEGMLRQMRQGLNLSNGKPCYAAVRIKKVEGEVDQSWEVLFDIPFDAEYAMEYAYRAIPPRLSSTKPIPYGGARHRETILAAVLAYGHSRIGSADDAALHEGVFQRCLAASIKADQQNQPPTLGYNGDPSTGEAVANPRFWSVTFHGVQY